MATFLRGGQRRTIEAGCGWGCVGHPTEVNKKFKIHKRYCNDCKNNNVTELPAFNSEGGWMNGWKGLNNKGKNPEEKLTTAIINGVTQIIHHKPNEDVYDVVNNEKFISVLTEEKKPISKSQKKRQKQKAKKQKDLCSNCGEMPVTNNGNCFDDWCERCDAFASGWATAEISKEKDLQGVMGFLNERVKDGDKVIFAPLNYPTDEEICDRHITKLFKAYKIDRKQRPLPLHIKQDITRVLENIGWSCWFADWLNHRIYCWILEINATASKPNLEDFIHWEEIPSDSESEEE